MTTAEVMMATPKFQQQQLIEHYWQSALDQLNRGSSEVVLPLSVASSIGQHGITAIADRFSAFINAHASVLHDPSLSVIRILPPPQGHLSAIQSLTPAVPVTPATTASTTGSQMSSNGSPTLSMTSPKAFSQPLDSRASSNAKAKVAKDRMSKVPRPPNAFILYRQHHHPLVKQSNPGLHNNQISVIIGKQWKNEDEETQTFFKKRADEVKRKHFEDHPQYQYQPRKPSDRKRRITKSKTAKMVAATSKASSSTAAPLAPAQTHDSISETVPTNTLNVEPVMFADNDAATSTAINPLLTQLVPQVEVVPDFQLTSDGLLIVHDFSADQSALFEQMIEQYNHSTNAPIWPPDTLPDVLMPVQTDEAGDDHLYHEAHIDFNKLEAEIKAINDERDAAFNAQYPDIDLNGSLYTTVAEYNESWLQWSKNEDQRMTELELEFGTGPYGEYNPDAFDIPAGFDGFGISDTTNPNS